VKPTDTIARLDQLLARQQHRGHRLRGGVLEPAPRPPNITETEDARGRHRVLRREKEEPGAEMNWATFDQNKTIRRSSRSVRVPATAQRSARAQLHAAA